MRREPGLRFLGLAGNDERCAGLIDEDVVDLVDNCEIVPPLDSLVKLRAMLSRR